MTHKIAILKTREFTNYSDYDGYSVEKIIESITDWTEVSDEDFKILVNFSTSKGFVVLEQPVDTKTFVAKTVAEYLIFVEALKRRQEEEKKKREEAALNRKLKKEFKESKSKKALYEQLKAEFENK
jgi:hypothetical protein